jgi:hypothetical protein
MPTSQSNNGMHLYGSSSTLSTKMIEQPRYDMERFSTAVSCNRDHPWNDVGRGVTLFRSANQVIHYRVLYRKINVALWRITHATEVITQNYLMIPTF